MGGVSLKRDIYKFTLHVFCICDGLLVSWTCNLLDLELCACWFSAIIS